MGPVNNLLNFRGMNLLILGVAVGLNFFWSLMIVIVTAIVLSGGNMSQPLVQAGMVFVFFGGAFTIGWLAGKMAADGRGPGYGFWGAMGGVLPILIIVVPTGIFGVILVAVVLLGGFNGGLISVQTKRRR